MSERSTSSGIGTGSKKADSRRDTFTGMVRSFQASFRSVLRDEFTFFNERAIVVSKAEVDVFA